MSEPICKCGHRKTWHRDQAGACIYPIDGVNDCDCKGYALPHPTPTLRDQFAMAAPVDWSIPSDALFEQVTYRYRFADAMMEEREKGGGV